MDKKWKILYFDKKVVASLESWPPFLRAKYLRMVDLIEEYGPHLGHPLTKSVQDGLYEIRVKAKEGIGRAFFCYICKCEIIILHAFLKKSDKTPKKEIEKAMKYMKEVSL